MKKIKIIFCILFILLIFTGCTKETESKYLIEVSYKEFEQMRDNKEKFFIAIVQDDCIHCEAYLPVLTKVLEEYQITGYQVDLGEMSEEDADKLDKEYGIHSTPYTLFFEDGQETSKMQRIVGEADEERIILKLKNNGYIQ